MSDSLHDLPTLFRPSAVNPLLWLFGLLVALVALVLRNWLKRFVQQLLPSPQRVLYILQTFICPSPVSGNSLVVVLSWLAGDPTGKYTQIVEDAFRDVDGVELVRSGRIITASGARDAWSSKMRSRSQTLLRRFTADVAIVGSTKDADAICLWFVPSVGDGTLLERGDRPFTLKHRTLKEDFHQELRVQIAAIALSAVSLCRNFERRHTINSDVLRQHVEKVDKLLSRPNKYNDKQLAQLHASHGLALLALGDIAGAPDVLIRAVEAHEKALNVKIEQDTEWAQWSNDIANALLLLMRHQQHPARCATLRRAIDACHAAVHATDRRRMAATGCQRKDTLWVWANAQHTLGVALSFMAGCQADALAAFDAALSFFSKDEYPFSWAITSLWLGKVATYRSFEGIEQNLVPPSESRRIEILTLLREAINSFDNALGVFTPQNAPLFWAQARLENPLFAANKNTLRETANALEQALDLYRSCPLYCAEIQSNLGDVLARLAALSMEVDDLNGAVAACRSALKTQTAHGVPWEWSTTQLRLGGALVQLGKRKGDAKQFKEAVQAYKAALPVRKQDGGPEAWAHASVELGKALVWLGKCQDGMPRLREAENAVRGAQGVYAERGRVVSEARALVPLLDVYGILLALGEDIKRIEEEIYKARKKTESLRDSSLDFYTMGMLRGGLGYAMSILGEVKEDEATVREGIDSLTEALKLFDRQGMALERARVRLDLGRAYSLLLLLGSGGEPDMRLALMHCRLARTEGYIRELAPFESTELAVTQGALLSMFLDKDGLVELEERLLEVIELVDGESAPLSWVDVQATRAFVLYRLGKVAGQGEYCERAVEMVEAAVENCREGVAPRIRETMLTMAEAFRSARGN